MLIFKHKSDLLWPPMPFKVMKNLRQVGIHRKFYQNLFTDEYAKKILLNLVVSEFVLDVEKLMYLIR